MKNLSNWNFVQNSKLPSRYLCYIIIKLFHISLFIDTWTHWNELNWMHKLRYSMKCFIVPESNIKFMTNKDVIMMLKFWFHQLAVYLSNMIQSEFISPFSMMALIKLRIIISNTHICTCLSELNRSLWYRLYVIKNNCRLVLMIVIKFKYCP